MGAYSFEERLKNKKPYFGNSYFSWQGLPSRHVYMLAILQYLIKENSHAFLNILEIGSWTGGSAITWAEGINRYNSGNGIIFCVDPWELYFDAKAHNNDEWNVFYEMEKVFTEYDLFSLFLHNINTSGFKNCIVPINGKSSDVTPRLRTEAFDLIFIDGSHTYDAVAEDIRNSIPLLKNGGIICGDDLEMEMWECDMEAAKSCAHLEYSKDPKTNAFFHPGVSLAVGDIIGRVSSWDGFWAMQMINGQWQKIDIKDSELRTPGHLYEAIAAGVVDGSSIKGINVSNP